MFARSGFPLLHTEPTVPVGPLRSVLSDSVIEYAGPSHDSGVTNVGEDSSHSHRIVIRQDPLTEHKVREPSLSIDKNIATYHLIPVDRYHHLWYPVQ